MRYTTYMQSKSIVINSRFKGPPNSGNGGYSAGLLADALGGDAKVVLRSPPPLDTVLELNFNDRLATLNKGSLVIANAQKFRLNIDVPDCPPIDLVQSSAGNYLSAEEHALASCFVCGPGRQQGDGLQIFPVTIEGYNCVASVWLPYDNLSDDDGLIYNQFIWAALDCPGYFAHQEPNKQMLLGSMTASILRRPRAQETLISIGWQTGVDGRKYLSGTAVYDKAGQVCAASQQVWVVLKTSG